MKDFRKFLIVIVFFAGVISLNSCNKNEDVNEEVAAKTTVQDYITTINSFSLSTVEEITSNENDNLKSATIVDCLTVTIHENEDGEFWPRSWTLDYGNENCECYKGISRRGKIHVSISDWWRDEGSYREIIFEDFYFNNNKLVGLKTFLNTGLNESGNITFTKTVADAQLTYGDTATMSWNSKKYSELIEGSETFKFADDVWSVTGGGSGVNIDGNNYTFTITSALIYKNGCFFPVSGEIEFTVPNEERIIINYGNGECDDVATTKVGDGEATEIEL